MFSGNVYFFLVSKVLSYLQTSVFLLLPGSTWRARQGAGSALMDCLFPPDLFGPEPRVGTPGGRSRPVSFQFQLSAVCHAAHFLMRKPCSPLKEWASDRHFISTHRGAYEIVTFLLPPCELVQHHDEIHRVRSSTEAEPPACRFRAGAPLHTHSGRTRNPGGRGRGRAARPLRSKTRVVRLFGSVCAHPHHPRSYSQTLKACCHRPPFLLLEK